MPRWKVEKLATDLAPVIAEILAEKLTGQLRPDLLMGDDIVFSGDEAGRVLNSSERTLEHWRALGLGPKCVKLGERRIGYRLGELRSYIREAERGPTRRQAVAASQPLTRFPTP